MIEGILSFMVALGLAQPSGSSTLSVPWALTLVVATLALLHRAHHQLADRVIAQRSPRAWWRLVVPVIHLCVFWALQDFAWGAVCGRGASDWPRSLSVVVALVPWLGMHLSWLSARRRIEVAIRRKSWPLLHYLLFHVRIWVIPLSPVLLTEGAGAAVTSFPSIATAVGAYQSLSIVGSLLLIVALFSLAPFMARLAVPTHSLPDGALRTTLEGVARGAGFRCLDIRVCNTRNHVANAAFLGVLGKLRYVIITDGLLQRLSREELAGVFAHEVGHSMRRHVLLNLCMIAAFTVFSALLSRDLDPESTLGLLPLLFGFPAFLLLVYAPIARRFESEADLFAAMTLGTPRPIVDSLNALGRLYPHRRRHGGLVHPGLDERVAFIEQASIDPGIRTAFEQGMRTLKQRICLVALLPVIWLAIQIPNELSAGSLRYAVLEASRTEDEAAALQCIERLEQWRAEGGVDPGFELGMWSWQTLALARQQRGDFDGAAEAIEVITARRGELERTVLLYNAAVITAQQAAAIGAWNILDDEASLARRHLSSLVPLYGERDEQIVREQRDVAFLLAGRNCLRRWGVLAGDAGRRTLRLLPVDAKAISQLEKGGEFTESPRLRPPWKAAFREHLMAARKPQ